MSLSEVRLGWDVVGINCRECWPSNNVLYSALRFAEVRRRLQVFAAVPSLAARFPRSAVAQPS